MTNATISADTLKGVAFFANLPSTLLWHLSRVAELRTLATDEHLFVEGAPRRFFGVILTGTLAIEHGAARQRLATLGAGEVIGEGVLLEDVTHGTSARALQTTTLLLFAKDTLAPVLKDQPSVHAALVSRAAQAIAARLKSADATLSGRGRAMSFAGGARRMEHDLLGDREIPDAALYGVQTLRALENFPITGVPLREFPELIIALAQVKQAAARANAELGFIAPEVCDVIVRAAQEIVEGRHHEHFLVDMIQGGAGTSTNMNANEVIANRALELLGLPRGAYDRVHPNNHVNHSQSTNDVYPTSVKLAMHTAIDGLKEAMTELITAFLAKGEEFAPYLKMGARSCRTPSR